MLLKIGCAIAAAILLSTERTRAADVVDLAASLIGRPYVWGAEGPNTFDCSGLTQYVFREFAINLPRRAISQSRAGDLIGRRMQRGDLVFFSSDRRKAVVTHVGIYEGGGRMIEASKSAGRVRRSDLDDPYWVERFMFARRVIDNRGRPELARDRRGEPEDEAAPPSKRKSGVRDVAVRALEEFAGVLLRRPR